MAKKAHVVSQKQIEDAVLLMRGEKALLDANLADLYGVTTKALNQAVKRNRGRFPDDFMFRLTAKETRELNRSQLVTGSQKHRDPRYPPYSFLHLPLRKLVAVGCASRTKTSGIRRTIRRFSATQRVPQISVRGAHPTRFIFYKLLTTP
jgi:ORF6N domain-containing protein